MGRETVMILVHLGIRLGRFIVADPLSRRPMAAGQVICCAPGVACTRKADVSDI